MRKITEIGIPVIITLHDQRLITGGCHTSLDCREFQSGCKNCPKISYLLRPKVRRNSKDLHNFFNNSYQNLQVTAPSNFMKRQSSKSSIMSYRNLTFLPNHIPRYVNNKMPKTAEKKYFINCTIDGS
jgi:hypothetical protein